MLDFGKIGELADVLTTATQNLDKRLEAIDARLEVANKFAAAQLVASGANIPESTMILCLTILGQYDAD